MTVRDLRADACDRARLIWVARVYPKSRATFGARITRPHPPTTPAIRGDEWDFADGLAPTLLYSYTDKLLIQPPLSTILHINPSTVSLSN